MCRPARQNVDLSPTRAASRRTVCHNHAAGISRRIVRAGGFGAGRRRGLAHGMQERLGLDAQVSPTALLFIGRPKRPRYADIGPSRDQVAPLLAHLWTVHSPKPPHSQAKPLATA